MYLRIRRTLLFSKLLYQKGQIMEKKFYLLCSMLLLHGFVIAEHVAHGKVEYVVEDAQAKAENERIDALYAPVTFTQVGINDFFKKTINALPYRQEVLPNNFSHLVQFMEYGLKRRQGRAYTQSIMRLFNNVLKGSMYINAYAFNDALDQMIPLLHTQCIAQAVDPADAMKKHINDTLYANFLNKFDVFKKDPDAFFNGVSADITSYAQGHQYLGGDVSCQEFRKTLMTFLEHSLGKLVWDPKGGLDTWNNVKKLAQSIEKLLDKKIITDEDDVNDLCISLVERYCLFLDINAQSLPLDCYREIKKDVLAQNLYFLELDEQEPFLEKKSQRMLRALLEGEAKVRAAEYGIITS